MEVEDLLDSQDAFIYTPENGLVALDSLIDPLSGWHLHEAFDINDAGQIVAVGTLAGMSRAVLLTPVPEPTSAWLLILGAVVATRKGLRIASRAPLTR